MPRVSAAFFMTGALFLLIGMCWGMAMAMTENFTLAPAHAHLNLLGWVTMSIYGGFYALTQKTMSPRLAWINYGCATLGVGIMIPTLAVFLTTGNQALGPVIGLGGVLNIIGLLTFSISAYRELKRVRVD
jgi:ABC-type multidrug transport system fused ATPase/permease subunit